nr:hypothetical protein [Tanacetum cinerariifolium]
MRWYDYGYLKEFVVRIYDNVLYKFKEGDFPRLNLRDIEDMLLLLVQKKMSNLDVDDRYNLGVALRMFTKRIVILYRVEDLQVSKRQRFYAYVCHWKSPHDVYPKRRIIVVTSVKVMRWYDYGYLKEFVVRIYDNVLYKFKEGDFPRLNLRDIEDILLLLVQKKMSNLDVDDRYNLGVALRMFTKRIVILYRVEDLQLGNRLLAKETLECLEKKRSRIMIKAIDKLLFERRLMRNLEKFAGGCDYEN